jgi:hypothetical protein
MTGIRGKFTTNDEDFENILHRYRFMFTPLEERIRVLDRHLKRIQVHSIICLISMRRFYFRNNPIGIGWNERSPENPRAHPRWCAVPRPCLGLREDSVWFLGGENQQFVDPSRRFIVFYFFSRLLILIALTLIYCSGSRSESSGRRVRLDIKDIPAYSLFPGQVSICRVKIPTFHF